MALRTDNLPQGELYDFLKSAGVVAGSGPEQINEQVGTGYIRSMSCILAATLDPAKGFEEFSFDGLTIMIFALMPVTVAGRSIYTPVRIGA